MRNIHYIAGVKHCNVSEFEEFGVSMDDDDKELISMRLCPDVKEVLKPFFKVKNGYSNKKLRYSYSLEVVRC